MTSPLPPSQPRAGSQEAPSRPQPPVPQATPEAGWPELADTGAGDEDHAFVSFRENAQVSEWMWEEDVAPGDQMWPGLPEPEPEPTMDIARQAIERVERLNKLAKEQRGDEWSG